MTRLQQVVAALHQVRAAGVIVDVLTISEAVFMELKSDAEANLYITYLPTRQENYLCGARVLIRPSYPSPHDDSGRLLTPEGDEITPTSGTGHGFFRE